MSEPEQGSSDAATFATQLLYSFTNIEDPNARKRAKELAQSWMGTDRHRTPSDRSSISMVDLLLGCIDQEGAEVRQFARQLYDSHHQQMSEG